MRLSSKSRYSLKAMYFLAMQKEDSVKPLSEVAKCSDVSLPYLEKLMAMLKKAGLVTSIRGAQGGYALARAPKDISVGDVVRVMEPDLVVSGCSDEKCDKKNCPNKNIFVNLFIEVNKLLDKTSLQDMIDG